jgi:hypothetical protein
LTVRLLRTLLDADAAAEGPGGPATDHVLLDLPTRGALRDVVDVRLDVGPLRPAREAEAVHHGAGAGVQQ